jgi:general secretion pathway protein F
MPKFSYRAKKGVNEIVEDVIEAASVNEAVLKVTQKGYVPIDINIYQENMPKLASRRVKSLPDIFSKRISRHQVVAFTRQLYDLVDAGIPVLRALRLLASQDSNLKVKGILEDAANFVQDGGALSDALSQYPETFSALYVNLVRSGESSGHLNTVLGRLADFLEKDEQISAKAISSLIYPDLIMTVGAATVFVLLSFVIPRLAEMFEELSQGLPWPTVFLMAVSNFFARFWWLILLVIGAGVFYFKHLYSMPQERIKIDKWQLQIPLIGEFIMKLEIVRFAQTLATLLEGGVSIVEALKGVSAVVVNQALRKEIEKVASDVSKGSSLAESLKETSFFPENVINMIIVGEESGHLEQALSKVGLSYERQTDEVMKRITSLLEPALIVFVGLVIGFIVVAMLLPIFRMNLIIQ